MGLTGTFYAVAYLGFLTPTVLAAVTRWLPPADLVLLVAGAALLSLAVVLGSYRKHLPSSPDPSALR